MLWSCTLGCRAGELKKLPTPQVMVLQDKNWQLGDWEKRAPPPKKGPRKDGDLWHCACWQISVSFFFRWFCSRKFFLLSASVSSFRVSFFLVFFFCFWLQWAATKMKDRILTANDGLSFRFVGREGRGWIYSPGKYHISLPNGKRRIIDSKKSQTGGDMFVPWRVDT